jgi:hypothetical protein
MTLEGGPATPIGPTIIIIIIFFQFGPWGWPDHPQWQSHPRPTMVVRPPLSFLKIFLNFLLFLFLFIF